MKNYCFTDSSGILARDRFFGTGLLVVRNVGDLGDKLYKNSQPARAKLKTQKNQAIQTRLAAGDKDSVIAMLQSNAHFEMKFDNIGNSQTLPFYESMVDVFFADADNRFSAMIVDRNNPNFNTATISDAWETYTKYIALLVVKEMANLPNDDFFIVVDEISKPRNKPLSLEDTVMSKIREECAKRKLDFNKVFGTLTIESHSNLSMQLCDVLLGAVMYDYKENATLNSAKTQSRKEPFVAKVRKTLNRTSLLGEFDQNDTSAYFCVCNET